MEEAKHETDMDNNPRILDLSLCYKWYDMIASGEKTEEYREIKKFYCERLGDYCQYKNFDDSCSFGRTTLIAQCSLYKQMCYCQSVYSKMYNYVRFHRGQGSKETMLFEYKGLTIGFGNPEWGAPKDKRVFIIRLGKRVKIILRKEE
jgi:hypothetical protein